jgi:hypothetical protein
MADGGNNPWVTIAVAAIGAVGAIGAAMVVRGANNAPAKVETVAPQPVVSQTTMAAPVEATQTASATPDPVQQVGATTAPAQQVDWRQQVLGFLDTQHKPLMDRGYVRDDGTEDWVGLLKVGTPKVWEVQLVRGVDYQVVGVCDRDCKNVDMEIYDPAGAKVGGDTLEDDAPQVMFKPTSSGAHTVKVWLRSCTSADGTQSCVVAARVLRR